MNSSPDAQPSEFATHLELLRTVPFFAGLPLEALKVLAYLGTHEVFREGEHVFRQGDEDGRAYLVLSGRCSLVRTPEQGDEFLITEISQGAFMGGLSLLAESRRLFSLRVLERTECLCLTREKFLRTMERFPDMMPKVMEAVVRGVMDWEHKFVLDHTEMCGLCRQRLGVSLV